MTTLKEGVPVLVSKAALKAQFDWLTDGGIGSNIGNNLSTELKNLEMFLRYVLFDSLVFAGIFERGGWGGGGFLQSPDSYNQCCGSGMILFRIRLCNFRIPEPDPDPSVIFAKKSQF